MTQLSYYEVDVPMHHCTNQSRHGLHAFTGPATGARDALTAARAAYDRAAQHVAASSTVPDAPGDGWAVRGLRPDWVLDWQKATANEWGNPNSLI
ncbi:hypothetical protein [Streptomyces sp. NBC_01320]|uniref:hypothetical protein n=1 Tax=Streptomyces sp. NBC_01320 TaxID=2903824 RepID=UPI002E106D20|nr:hypothetical protein OG395_56905 [Streptomyces sp. NBC_01320]